MTRTAPLSVFRTLDDVDVAGKKVLVRADLNVPMEDSKITDATRIDRILVNIHEISEKKGKVILLSHLGRPKNGPEAETSLKSVAVALEQAAHAVHVFGGDQRFQIDAGQVAAPGGEVALIVVDIGDAAAHPGGEVASG